MRLIFIGADCVKRISGGAVPDIDGGVIADETPEVSGAPMRLVKLIGGNVTLIPEPPPTPEEQAAAEAKADKDEILRKIIQVLFSYENRIRALEAKPPVTKAQFISAIKALA